MVSCFKNYLFSAAIVMLCAGCSGLTPKEIVWKDASVDLVWPEPPSQSRVEFLRSLSGPKDFKKEGAAQKTWRWIFGEEEADLQLLTPFAVASDKGLVWVADSGARMLYRIDMSLQKVSYFREFDGKLLTLPSGVALDPLRDRVFLSDAAASQVYVLNSKGELLDQWSPPEGFLRPAGLAIAPTGELYACDAVAGKVYVFDSSGTHISTIHSQVNSDGRFLRPLSVALGPAGEVVVLDALAFRVEVLSRQGVLIAEIGKIGDSAGSFARLKGVAVDQQGHVFISDAAFDNIQVFDLAGNLLMYWGQAGSQPGQFSLPSGLFVDRLNRLFVADSYNHRVQVFQLISSLEE